MTKQILNALNSNIDFIQLKLFDFSDEKIDQEKKLLTIIKASFS